MGDDVVYGFKKLDVWKLGMELVNTVYKLTKNFPDEEKFSLTSQLRRATISVPLNIAEGSVKGSKKDFAHFTRIALGSLMEVVACLEIALQQNYIKDSEYQNIDKEIEKLYFKLIGLNKFLKK